MWTSVDPILSSYIDGEPNNGVFSSINLSPMAYGAENPLRYTDPDGNNPVAGAIIGAVVNSAFYAGKCLYTNEQMTAKGFNESFGTGAKIGAVIGFLPVEAALVGGAALWGLSTGSLINEAENYDKLDEKGKKGFQFDVGADILSGALLFTAGAKVSGDGTKAKATENGESFPVGTNKQSLVGINPKTLKPTKQGPLDQERLNYIRKNDAAKFKPIDTDRNGNIQQGHHRQAIAIEEGRAVDVDISQ